MRAHERCRERSLAKGRGQRLSLDFNINGGVATGLYALQVLYRVFGNQTAACNAAKALTMRIHISRPRHLTALQLNRVGIKLMKKRAQAYRYIEIRGTRENGHFRASFRKNLSPSAAY